ncbi:MAG: hypothetical protein ACI9O4_000053 [Chitinophagales bacterium]|jgi:hypothetical protein
MMKYILLGIFLLAVSACTNPNDQHAITDVYSLGDGENGLARQDYEWQRLHNPVSGEIPADITLAEFQFISNLPIRKSLSDLTWQQRGPVNIGGRTRALALDVNNENRILAGGVSGGLWISENGGQSFNKVTTNLMLHAITSIAQDVRIGFQDTWYYGTGELSGNSADLEGHGIYKSSDNGATWSILFSTLNDSSNIVSNLGDFKYVQDVKVNPVNGDVVVASFAGIFISQNGGNSWQNVLIADGSPDGFNYVNFGNQNSVVVNDNGEYYATLSVDAQNAGIWRSTDGITWVDITPNGFPASFRRNECDFNPFDNNELLFIVDATTNPSVDNHELWHYTYLSGDGSGINGTWEDRTVNLPDGDCLGFYDFNFGYFQSQNSYDLLIAYHPSVEDLVFIGGTNLYRSTDAFQSTTNYKWIGGYQCDALNPSNYIWPNHHPDNHVLTFLPSNNSVMISAHDGGLSITQDCLASSISWESMNNGYGTSQFYTVAIEQGNTNSDFIIGGLQDNGTWLTNSIDPNDAWVNTFYGDGAYCAIAENQSSVYVSWQGGKTFKFDIDQNGQTTGLTRIDPIGGADYRFINPFILDPNDDNTMYLPAGRYIWKNDSLDAIPLINDEYNALGQGWTRINESISNSGISATPNYISAIGMSEANSDVLYYGTHNGIVFKLSGVLTGTLLKENLKQSNLPSGAYVSSIVPNPNNEDEVLLSYSNYETESIFFTNNGGDTWTNISGSLEENPDGSGAGPSVNWMHLYQDNEDTIYFAGTTSGLFATNELQAENTIWERQAINEIGNVPVSMITSRTFDKNIVVATHGGGIYSTKQFEVGIKAVNELEHIVLGFPFPNPSSSSIKLSLDLTAKSNISMKVFDLLGVYMETLVDGELNEGKHQLKWSTSAYSEGMYIVAVNDGKSIVSRKFSVVR